MAYIGPQPKLGQNREVDDISSGFNGSTTAFTLQVGGSNASPGSANGIIVSVNNIVLNPNTAYTVNGSTITFTTAPTNGHAFFGLILGQGIDSGEVSNGSVSTVKLADDAVTSAKMADDAVIAAHIADNAVVTAAINADAVTGAKIADDSINSEHYVDGSIDTAHIADSQITTAKIADDAVTSAKLASSSVTADALGSEVVGTANIAANAITSAKIVNGGVGTDDLADDAVTSAKLASSSVGADALGSEVVGTANIANDAITNAKVADDAIGIAQLSATGTASSSTFLRGDNTFAAAGGGKVNQVVQSVKTGSVSTTDSNYNPGTDTGLNVTITPSASDSKVLILIHANFASDACRINPVLKDGSSAFSFGVSNTGLMDYGLGNSDTDPIRFSFAYLVTPGDTNAHTYKLFFSKHGGGGTAYFNYASGSQQMSVSTMTAIEVKA